MVRGGVKQWELQVDHSLFAIHKLDITVRAFVCVCVCVLVGAFFFTSFSICRVMAVMS